MTGFGPPQSLSGSSLEVADSPNMTFHDPRHRLSAATIFQQAKHPHSDCEDALVLNPSGWAGVVDGATAKSPTLFPLPRGGTGSSGLFATQVVADTLAEGDAGLSPRELVTLVSDTLRDRIADVEVEPLTGAVPTCCFAVTNGDTIVAVGDCGYAFLTETGQVEEWRGDLAVDIYAISQRVKAVETALQSRTPEELLAGEDPGRAAILPILKRQNSWVNQVDHPLGFPAINGTPVPDSFIHVAEVPPPVARIVFTTDGYPRMSVDGQTLSFSAAEGYLANALQQDPLCIGMLAGTKWLQPGANSFDDRTWLELAIRRA